MTFFYAWETGRDNLSCLAKSSSNSQAWLHLWSRVNLPLLDQLTLLNKPIREIDAEFTLVGCSLSLSLFLCWFKSYWITGVSHCRVKCGSFWGIWWNDLWLLTGLLHTWKVLCINAALVKILFHWVKKWKINGYSLLFLKWKRKEAPPNPRNDLAEGMCSCLQLLLLVFRDWNGIFCYTQQ